MEPLEAGVFLCAAALFSLVFVLGWIQVEKIKQDRIDRRAGMRQSLQSSKEDREPQQEWYVPILLELAKNPEIQKMAIGYLQKFQLKEGVKDGSVQTL